MNLKMTRTDLSDILSENNKDDMSQPNNTRKRKVEDPLLPPCRVCGSKASGYHYGIIACGACKVFFRRSIQMKTPYKCKGNDRCLIQPDHSVPCPHCRIKKCLQVGMSKDGIRMGRYTNTRKSAVIKEVQSIEEREIKEKEEAKEREKRREEELRFLVDATLEADTRFPFASPEMISYVPKKQQNYLETRKIQENVYGSMKPVPNTMYEHLFYTFGLELDDRRDRIQMCLNKVEEEIMANINFALSLPDFRSFHIDDQVILVRNSQWEMFFFSTLPLINTKEKLVTCPSCGYTASSEDADVIYEEAFDVSLMRSAELLEPLHLTTTELALVKAICIINPDAGIWPPKDREKIGEIQQKYIDALIYVFEKANRDTSIAFGRITHCMTSVKSLLHRYFKKSRNWTNMFPGVVCSSDLAKEWLGPIGHDEYPCTSITKSILLGERPPASNPTSKSADDKSPFFLDRNPNVWVAVNSDDSGPSTLTAL